MTTLSKWTSPVSPMISGITGDFPYYDAHKDYEINNRDYWTYFEDVDIHFNKDFNDEE